MLSSILILLHLSTSYAATDAAQPISLKQTCTAYLQNYPSYFKDEALEQVCERAAQNDDCKSAEGVPIFHTDFPSKKAEPRKILVISLIHGDETAAGGLGRFWMERLQKVDARNSWRIIPVANPDGVKLKTRTNKNGIDLNRNFPTVDWSSDAIKYWESSTKKNPRRFPGYAAGGEPETQCLLKHLDEYKPDFVVSIHTPLKVLDFDGPKLRNRVPYSYLPWRTLGNFPGSLGRYMWVERQTPVLTTELRESLPDSGVVFEQLQDLVGTLVKKDLLK